MIVRGPGQIHRHIPSVPTHTGIHYIRQRRRVRRCRSETRLTRTQLTIHRVSIDRRKAKARAAIASNQQPVRLPRVARRQTRIHRVRSKRHRGTRAVRQPRTRCHHHQSDDTIQRQTRRCRSHTITGAVVNNAPIVRRIYTGRRINRETRRRRSTELAAIIETDSSLLPLITCRTTSGDRKDRRIAQTSHHRYRWLSNNR